MVNGYSPYIFVIFIYNIYLYIIIYICILYIFICPYMDIHILQIDSCKTYPVGFSQWSRWLFAGSGEVVRLAGEGAFFSGGNLWFHRGIPNGWLVKNQGKPTMENPIQIDDLGVYTQISGNLHIYDDWCMMKLPFGSIWGNILWYTFFVEKPMCECQELPASKAGSEGTVQGILWSNPSCR